jgi:hypothetical protein
LRSTPRWRDLLGSARSEADLLVKVDNFGTIRVYDESRNLFGSYDMSGGTRTFFPPNDGIAYFLNEVGGTLYRVRPDGSLIRIDP